MKKISNKGITLVALVITIIIIIILAGITLGALLGSNGLITRTKKAVEYYEKAQQDEIIEMDKLYTRLANIGESSGIAESEIKEVVEKIIDAKTLEKYPIGSIYLSTENTNPSKMIGGEWKQLKDSFLLGAGDTYKAGTAGGEATHTLTVDEMPSHTHTLTPYSLYLLGGSSVSGLGSGGSGTYYWTDGSKVNSKSTGGNQAHNNMPPYLVVYMWQRIS